MDMRKEEFSERELRELEAEIRGLGTPYVSSEPDARYWANFRVSVMERIREEEARRAASWYQNVLVWIEEHVLVTSLSTAAVLVAVWASLMMQPLDSLKNKEVTVQHEVIADNHAEPLQPAEVQAAPAAHRTAKPQVEERSSSAVQPASEIADYPELAMLDESEMGAADEVGPASLDELSATELESVLNTLETESDR